MKFIVNNLDYNIAKDSRILIPFISEYPNKGGYKIGLIGKDGKVVLEPKYDIVIDDAYSVNDLIRIGIYDKEAHLGFSKYLYTIIDIKGEFILGDKLFDGIEISTDNQLLSIWSWDLGYAVLNREGKEVIPFGKYLYIDGFDQGIARVEIGSGTNCLLGSNTKWNIINKNGIELLPKHCDNILPFYKKGYDSVIVQKEMGNANECIKISELASK